MALEPYLAWDDIILGSTKFGTAIQVAYFNRYRKQHTDQNILSKHSTAQDINKYLGNEYDNMYKFATVRNPIELLTSLYFYSKKIVDNFLYQQNVEKSDRIDWLVSSLPEEWKWGEIFHLNYLLSEIDGSKLDGFVKRMISSKHNSVMPQSWRLTPDVEIFDISKINDNWDYITDKIGIEEIVILNQENKSTRYNDTAMSNESVRLIKKHFSDDFQWMPEKIGVSWDG